MALVVQNNIYSKDSMSTAQDNLATLIAQAAAQSQQGYAPAWMPKEGETVAGTVCAMDALPNDFGDPYPVITVQTLEPKVGDEGRLSVHGFHTALSSQLTNVKIGDIIGVTYLGKKQQKVKKKGVQAYENYRVALMDPEGNAKPTRAADFGPHADPPAKNDKISHPKVEGDDTSKAEDKEEIPF